MKGILKQNINYTRWERFVHRVLLFFFSEEVTDLMADSRGDGFAEGYKTGYTESQAKVKQGQIDLYDLGYERGKSEYAYKLRSFNPDSVVKVSGEKIFIGKVEVSETEAKALKEEVEWLRASKIWDIFTNTVAEQARATMFNLSETFDDMKTGKLMLMNLDLLDKLCDRILRYRAVPPEAKKPMDYGRIPIDNVI